MDIQNTNSGTEPPKGTTYTVKFRTTQDMIHITNNTMIVLQLVGYKNLMFGKLESVEIPSLTILECIDKISDKFKEYITVNKLCIENPETSKLNKLITKFNNKILVKLLIINFQTRKILDFMVLVDQG